MQGRPDNKKKYETLRNANKEARLADKQSEEERDLDNAEFYVIPASPRDIKNEPWLPYVRIGDKQGGANDAGPYGGVYGIPDKDNKGKYTDRAMFKRDTAVERRKKDRSPEEKIRVGKIIGEFVAGNMLSRIMQHIHQKDDPQYASKFVAKVSLVKAKTASIDPKNEVAFTYLKSDFLENYSGDFWQIAFIHHYGKEFADTHKTPYAEALKSSGLEGSDDQIMQLGRSMAKSEVVQKKYKEKKPKQVKQAFFKQYEDETIQIPAEMLKNNPALFTDFCEQIAGRLFLADYGIHTGNFGVIDDKSGTLRMGSIDFGAAFCNLLPEVLPFNRFGTGTKLYKNHLLEYDPNIIKSEELAKAFIRIGQLSEDEIGQMVQQAITDLENSNTYTKPEPVKKFCKRMGMPKKSYESANDMPTLLAHMKNFMQERFASRSQSLLTKGYGLMLEHCMGEKELDLKKLEALIKEFPGIKDFILSPDLLSYDKSLETKYTGKKQIDRKTLRTIQKLTKENFGKAPPIEPARTLQDIKQYADAFCRKIYDLADQLKPEEDNIDFINEQYQNMQQYIPQWYEGISAEISAKSSEITHDQDAKFLTSIRVSIEEAFDCFKGLDNDLKEKMITRQLLATPDEESLDSFLDNLGKFNDIMSTQIQRLSLAVEKPEVKQGAATQLAKNPATQFGKSHSKTKDRAYEVEQKKDDGPDNRAKQPGNKQKN